MQALAASAVALGMASSRAVAAAPDSATAARRWYEEIALNGFVTSSYSYNSGRPPTRGGFPH
jgi:hypothetical protein